MSEPSRYEVQYDHPLECRHPGRGFRPMCKRCMGTGKIRCSKCKESAATAVRETQVDRGHRGIEVETEYLCQTCLFWEGEWLDTDQG